MKATELRIGNWVNVISWDWSDFNGETEIDIKELEVIDNGFANVVGIPLTEEWLIKFGFEPNIEYGKYMNHEIYNTEEGYVYVVDSVENGYGDWDYTEVDIKHVHQFQNLYFALTNEELTIKL